jgi:hypothetical protein
MVPNAEPDRDGYPAFPATCSSIHLMLGSVNPPWELHTEATGWRINEISSSPLVGDTGSALRAWQRVDLCDGSYIIKLSPSSGESVVPAAALTA